MFGRREFLQYTAAAAVAATVPATSSASAHRQLPTRPIPQSDESLPIIGLGNSASFRDEDLTIASELLDIFLGHGGRYIDVGGVSRFSVGRLGIEKAASDKLFLGNYLDPTDANTMRDEAKRIAEAQGKSALDLVHTHNPAEYRSKHSIYRDVKEIGLARFIGIARSGQQYHEAIAELIKNGLVDAIQTNFSLLEPEAADYLLPLAQDSGVAVTINRPFINGKYFSVVRGHDLPAWAEEFDCRSWAQFSLKFILAHPAVTCVLTETSNPKHAVDNLGAGFGRLPDESEQRRMLAHMRDIAG